MQKPLKNGWRKVKLKEVCREITVGHVGSMAKEYVEEGIPFLRSQNILPFSLELSSVKYITPEFHAKLKKSALVPGDVAVVRTGYPGTACVIPSKLSICNCADLVIIRPSEEVNAKYLTCIFNSTWGQGTIAGTLVGVAQQHFNVSAAKEMEVNLPPRHTQDKIAAILSAYDRLIENNTRRIEILEEMARSIYREWFVKFRFPGHEQVQMVDSELGLIPEGWEVKNLSEICEIIMGLSPKSEFYNENAEGLPLHQGVTNFGAWFPTDKVYTTTITRLAKIGDILFSVRAPVGRINIANKTIVIGRGICAIRSKTGKQNFVLQQLKDKFYEDNLMGGGTIYPSVTKEEVQKIKMLVPLPEKILAFESQSLPVFRQIEVFLIKNINLRKTRDLLLPRLISGEIDVENLDINTGTIAA
jgi:type I restriction enzyme S subunit